MSAIDKIREMIEYEKEATLEKVLEKLVKGKKLEIELLKEFSKFLKGYHPPLYQTVKFVLEQEMLAYEKLNLALKEVKER